MSRRSPGFGQGGAPPEAEIYETLKPTKGPWNVSNMHSHTQESKVDKNRVLDFTTF